MTENTTLSEDGTISRAPEPEGILGTQTAITHSGCRGSGTNVVRMVRAGQECWVGKRNICPVCSRLGEDPPAYPGR